jgi:pyruvate dehydrogenase E1 component alpha subunit
MSDAQTYRTKDEVKEYQKHDPIEKVLETLKNNKWINDAEIEAAEGRVKAIVEESIKFAEESPFPPAEELYHDVYADPHYPFIEL